MKTRRISMGGIGISIREGTSDFKAAREVLERSAYERNIRSRGYRFAIEPRERWADLGANIGAFACLAAKRGAQVLMVEPDPANHALAVKNTKRFGAKIMAMNRAVTHTGEGRVSFFPADPRFAWRSCLAPIRGRERIEVGAISLKEIIGMGYDCVKMDIEGAEVEVIERCGVLREIRKLVMEYHFDRHRDMAIYHRTIARIEKTHEVKATRYKPELKVFVGRPPCTMVYAWRKEGA